MYESFFWNYYLKAENFVHRDLGSVSLCVHMFMRVCVTGVQRTGADRTAVLGTASRAGEQA